MSKLLLWGIVILLLVDVEGFIWLWEIYLDDMGVVVVCFDKVVFGVIVVYDGVCLVEQGEGDSFVFVFVCVLDVVVVVLDLQ